MSMSTKYTFSKISKMFAFLFEALGASNVCDTVMTMDLKYEP